MGAINPLLSLSLIGPTQNRADATAFVQEVLGFTFRNETKLEELLLGCTDATNQLTSALPQASPDWMKLMNQVAWEVMRPWVSMLETTIEHRVKGWVLKDAFVEDFQMGMTHLLHLEPYERATAIEEWIKAIHAAQEGMDEAAVSLIAEMSEPVPRSPFSDDPAYKEQIERIAEQNRINLASVEPVRQLTELSITVCKAVDKSLTMAESAPL